MKMLTLAMPDAHTRSELLVVVALLCAVSNWAWIGTITAASVHAALAAEAGEGVGLEALVVLAAHATRARAVRATVNRIDRVYMREPPYT